MNWKTCSVEAGDGIGKLRRLAGVSEAGARSRNPERSEGSLHRRQIRLRGFGGSALNFLAIRPRVTGMQKHGLTMFAKTCYSSLVPRVHPGLQCAVGFAVRLCARETC